MKTSTDGARWRAAGTAALLLVTGGVMGVLADRIWLSPPELRATPLTAEAMAARLGLASAEEAHVRALLDSLHAEILTVVEQGPDSLRMAVRNAQHRIEAALPPDVRPEFRAWMREHHDRMNRRMHGVTIDSAEMHRPDSSGAPDREHQPR